MVKISRGFVLSGEAAIHDGTSAEALPTRLSAGLPRVLPALLLVAAVVSLAVVPDEAIARTKVVWGRAFLLAAATTSFFFHAREGRVVLPWPTVLAMALLPGLLATTHTFHTTVASAPLARDEIVRLFLLPVALYAAGTILDGPSARRRFVLALAVGGLLIGGWALLQRLGGLLPFAVGVEPVRRAHAGFGNPVFLGAWLAMTTPLLLAEALTGPSPHRWVAALAAGLCLPALLATGSAGAWLGLGVALAVGLLLLTPAGRPRRVLLVLLVLGAAALGLVGGDVLLRPREHALIWRDTWTMFAERPAGVGPGQFQVAFLPYASDELLAEHPRHATIINDAHNEPLQVLAELGWPGLGAVLLAAAAIFVAARASLTSAVPAPDRSRQVAALAGGCGALAQSLVSPDLRFQVTVMLLGLLVGCAASFDRPLVVALRGGRAGRAALMLLALLALSATAADTQRRLGIARLLQPAPPWQPAPGLDARLAALRERVALSPSDPAAHYDLGAALAEAHRYDEGAAALQRSFELASDNPRVERALGIVLCLARRYGPASLHLARARTEFPDDVDVQHLLAFAAYAQGDVATALVEVEALLRQHPGHEKARLLLERLRE